MKFGVPTQNEWLMPIDRLKLKPEVEFEYGGRSFCETGSSYNSAVERYIFTKFGTITDSDLLRTCALSNRNRKLLRDVNGRHLENFNNVITMSPMVQFTKSRNQKLYSNTTSVWFYKTVNRFVQ